MSPEPVPSSTVPLQAAAYLAQSAAPDATEPASASVGRMGMTSLRIGGGLRELP